MKLRNSENKKLIKLAQKFKPFDYGYLLILEKQMLKQMQSYFEQSDISVDDPKIARQIKWALKLLDIADETNSAWKCHGSIFDKENYKTWLTTYINTKNYKRFTSYNFSWNDHNKDHLRRIKAWYLYNKLKYYYMFTWWN